MKKLLIYTWLPALLFAFATIGFTACGSDDDDDPTTPPKTEQGPTGGDSTTEGEGSEEENGGTPQKPATGEAIDLGLSVKWASCNVGATEPWEYGGYYSWGETYTKKIYDGSTYKYNKESKYNDKDNKTTLEPIDDVACVKWGDSWRMPTADEAKELINDCTWEFTILNDVRGYNVIGPNGNSIFLPAASWKGDAGSINGNGHDGIYSTSDKKDAITIYAIRFSCYENEYYGKGYYWHTLGSESPVAGITVRPVCK